MMCNCVVCEGAAGCVCVACERAGDMCENGTWRRLRHVLCTCERLSSYIYMDTVYMNIGFFLVCFRVSFSCFLCIVMR